MGFWEYVGSYHERLLFDAYQHAGAVLQCMVVATVVGVLIGVVTYRRERAAGLAAVTTSTVLTIPSLALIGLLIPVVGLGVAPTVIALTLYGLLPVVRNVPFSSSGPCPCPSPAPPGSPPRPSASAS